MEILCFRSIYFRESYVIRLFLEGLGEVVFVYSSVGNRVLIDMGGWGVGRGFFIIEVFFS